MKNQNANEFEKDEEDFDFFKKPKLSNQQSNPEPFKKKDDPKILDNVANYIKSNTKKVAFATIVAIGIASQIVIGLVLTSSKSSTPAAKILAPAKTVPPTAPIVIEATPGKNPGDLPYMDYSKVSKEDGERIKQALQQFQDINKQLIETSKEINQPKK